MRVFDYSFLKNESLPAKMITLAGGIYSLRTMAGVRREKYEKIFSKLEAVARIQSVKSSNAIEGIVTSDSRIEEIVNGSSAPRNYDEAEIAGFASRARVAYNSDQSDMINIAIFHNDKTY